MKRPPWLDISWRFRRVWERNLTVYQRIWKMNFIPPLCEPLLYLLAFGVGLSRLVGDLNYGGREISYLAFIAPALLAINIMNNAFFETTYASFVRMYYQKTFDAMLATPLSLAEVITAEIMWGATKALIGTAIMLTVVSLFGLVRYPEGLFVLPLSFLGGLAFAAAGMIFTALVPSIDVFNLPVFLFVTPMFLFSGTFFPTDQLPPWARVVAAGFPLTHLSNCTRNLCLGLVTPELLWGLAYLLAFSMLCCPLALLFMHRRLIQ